ncbi:MAG: hypothetical protein HFE83_10970 [Lachnospiraceae bacterium]|nr:hypothetical protein [Lachnospiraceae bacterium]
MSDGTYAIPGVPSTGDRIKLEFFSPAGSITGKLLPTGHVKDTIDFFWGGGAGRVYGIHCRCREPGCVSDSGGERSKGDRASRGGGGASRSP